MDFSHIILKASLTTSSWTRYKLIFVDYTLRYQPKNLEKEQKLMIFAVFLYFEAGTVIRPSGFAPRSEDRFSTYNL